MPKPSPMEVRPIGIVRSALKTRDEAPRQGREGAPDAWLEIDPAFPRDWRESCPAPRFSF